MTCEALSMIISASTLQIKKEESTVVIAQHSNNIEKVDMWADQVEEEEGNEVESMDSYSSIDNPSDAQNSNTPSSKAATGRKNQEQQLHHEAIRRHDEQATKSATVLGTKKGLSPNAAAFVPTGHKQNAAIVSTIIVLITSTSPQFRQGSN